VFAHLGQVVGSTTYRDSSVYNNDGTLTGYTGAGNLPQNRWGWDATTRRPMLGFDGSGTSIACSGVSAALASQSKATLTAWLYRPATSTKVLVGYQPSSGNRFGIQWYSDGNAYFIAENSGAAFGAWSNSLTGSHCFTLVFDGTKSGSSRISSYVDGVFVGNATTGTPPTALPSAATLGTSLAGVTSTTYGGGSVIDLLVHTRDLSASEIADASNPANVDLRIGAAPPLLLSARRYWGTGFNTGAALRLRYIASGGN